MENWILIAIISIIVIICVIVIIKLYVPKKADKFECPCKKNKGK